MLAFTNGLFFHPAFVPNLLSVFTDTGRSSPVEGRLRRYLGLRWYGARALLCLLFFSLRILPSAAKVWEVMMAHIDPVRFLQALLEGL